MAAAIGELAKQIRAVEADPSKVDTPISVAIDLQSLRQSEDPLSKSSAEIIESLQELRGMVAMIAGVVREEWGMRRDPRLEMTLDELTMAAMEACQMLDEPGVEEDSIARVARARECLERVRAATSYLRHRATGHLGRPG